MAPFLSTANARGTMLHSAARTTVPKALHLQLLLVQFQLRWQPYEVAACVGQYFTVRGGSGSSSTTAVVLLLPEPHCNTTAVVLLLPEPPRTVWGQQFCDWCLVQGETELCRSAFFLFWFMTDGWLWVWIPLPSPPRSHTHITITKEWLIMNCFLG